MSIKQFNGKYVPQADRIIFRINTTDNQEYRLLLTRRITRLILASNRQQTVAIEAARHPGSSSQAIAQFKQEALRQNTDFKEKFEPAEQLPIGEEPVLVTGVKTALEQQAGSTIALLQLSLKDGRNLDFKLPSATLQSLQLLLDQLQAQAEWGLTANTPHASAPAAKAAPPSPKIH